MSTELFTLGDYPLVIEPTCQVLEALGGSAASDDLLRLERLDTEQIHRAFVLPNSLVHFFGDHGTLEQAKHILCYTSAGRLSHFLARPGAEWELTALPAEITGTSILRPSARLVFKDARARAVFLHYLTQVHEGKIHNPSVSLMLENLAEPVRQIEVWGEELNGTDEE